ncbi:MAG TPA: hypothetical protein [Caudoviricetes sp.]|nr:MAG TPA: hypothetical protein [Caudoviricetes sp.]
MESQAIVNTMEVLETKPINELVTEATIKVCYVSENPNQNNTVINKEVGRQIAATLPGAPVVGFYDKESGDFVQHSRKVTISNGQVNIEDITKPYGFVSFDAPWYQDFMEDGQVRTYLMCKAYLWTRQYEEASQALNKGQSMELDEQTMSGYYEGDVFVFTAATLDKLCILGDAYAPCFEGAKIMSSYTKQYESLAEQVENILGRRYYVMNGQLQPKPEKITLEYALQLGWNLTDAVYMQLRNRGAEMKYDIQGIYSEGGTIFVILQDRESLEYVRVNLTITSEDTVELDSEMQAVRQTWSVKEPPAPEPVEPLGGTTVTATQDPASTASTGAPAAPAATPEPAPAPAGAGVFKKKKDDEDEGEGEGEGEGDDPKSDDGDGTDGGTDGGTDDGGDDDDDKKKKKKGNFAADGDGDDPKPEGSEGGLPDPSVGNPDPSDIPGPATFSANGEGGEPSAEPAADPEPTEPTTQFSAEPAAEPEGAPAVDYAAVIEDLKSQVETLTNELNGYRAKAAEEEKEKKQAMVTSYSEMLTEEEMKPVVEKLDEYSLDEIESKLAVTYARKQKNSGHPSTGFQVSVAGAAAVDHSLDGLPEFFIQALELDKKKELKI